MEVQKRHRLIQDQENVMTFKGKDVKLIPVKKQGLSVRGALGDLNTNAQVQREVVGKVAVTTAEFEKKVTLKKAENKSKFTHVQSKVDTGLVPKIQPAPRPPLRREESTGNLAARAAIRARAVLKDSQNALKETKVIKKPNLEKKSKVTKLVEVKEVNEQEEIKEQRKSLEKLKIENSVARSFESSEDENSLELPEDIEDIDARDFNNPLLLSIYVKDIYKYLRELEDRYAIEQDFLRNQAEIQGYMRSTLIDWIVDVQKQFGLYLETIQLTVGIIDRYLQVTPNVPRNQLQLVGIAALFIACKYEEIYVPETSDFILIADNTYTKEELFQRERDILSKLGFSLAKPIPLTFARRFVKAARGTSKNHHLAKYFIDLSLVDYSMAHYKPSELAAAAVCLSLYILSTKSLEAVWTPTLSYYSNYKLEHLLPIIRKIANIVINIEKSKYKAVYNRYNDKSLAYVSLLPQLKGVAIRALATESSD